MSKRKGGGAWKGRKFSRTSHPVWCYVGKHHVWMPDDVAARGRKKHGKPGWWFICKEHYDPVTIARQEGEADGA